MYAVLLFYVKKLYKLSLNKISYEVEGLHILLNKRNTFCLVKDKII